MFKVQGNNERGNPTYVDGNFTVCRINNKYVYKGICMKRCTIKRCPIVRERMEIERKKKRNKKRKKFEKTGITRNLLLKPEDRKNSSKKLDRSNKGNE